MSPSESDLRAALRDGEGDYRPDVDALVAHIRAGRGQRRTRVLGIAAAVIVVVAAAVGGAVIWGGSEGNQQSADPSASASHFHSRPLSVTPSSPATSSPGAVSVTCPSSAPRPIDPPVRVPTTAPKMAMFTAPVHTLVVCSYTDAAAPRQVTLTGSAATALTDSIEGASPARQPILCPDIATGETTLLALIPVTGDGTVLPTVTTDISVPDCNEPISNGTAARYNWRPPATLKAQLAAAR
ncbi:hypothetical protein [uncultured Jatrophihabitans sp.]|uniref:hypothetical protein n=1 Tax=uncultured Jatrophihabitans sp. TaxID=1610747 RepID=UPI0035C9BAD1